MTRTLRITSIIATVSVVVLFLFPLVFGSGTDDQIEKFLNSPSVVDNFRKNKADKVKSRADETSPLVKQAQAFALYLNPPPKPKPKRPKQASKPSLKPRPLGPVSAKFELRGTSYYPLRPEQSLALIDEPGKGLRWVRQSSKVGHLIIEQVKDGTVVVRDGQRTFELVSKRPTKRSLLKGESSVSGKGGAKTPVEVAGRRIPTKDTLLSKPGTPELPQPTAEELADMDDFFKAVDAIIEAERAGVLEDSDELLDKLMRTGRISEEEAERLELLGKQLNEAEADPNKSKDNKPQEVSGPKVRRGRASQR